MRAPRIKPERASLRSTARSVRKYPDGTFSSRRISLVDPTFSLPLGRLVSKTAIVSGHPNALVNHPEGLLWKRTLKTR